MLDAKKLMIAVFALITIGTGTAFGAYYWSSGSCCPCSDGMVPFEAWYFDPYPLNAQDCFGYWNDGTNTGWFAGSLVEPYNDRYLGTWGTGSIPGYLGGIQLGTFYMARNNVPERVTWNGTWARTATNEGGYMWGVREYRADED